MDSGELGSASRMINLLTTGPQWPAYQLAFRSLGPVFGATLLPVVYSRSIKRATDDVILHAWQILHSSSADQNHGVLLKVVSLSWNICCYFAIVTQSHPADFTKCRVRLLRSHRTHLRANASFLRSTFELQPPLLQRVVRKLQIRRFRSFLRRFAPLRTS